MTTHAISRHRLWRCRVLLLVAVFALCGTLGAAGRSADNASAHYSFCTGTYTAYQHCDGSYTHLTGTQNYGSLRVCAGAVAPDGTFYASYVCGTTFAEHCYGNETLAPRIHNGADQTQDMHGEVYHDGETCP